MDSSLMLPHKSIPIVLGSKLLALFSHEDQFLKLAKSIFPGSCKCLIQTLGRIRIHLKSEAAQTVVLDFLFRWS